jgi:hypothetical protein
LATPNYGYEKRQKELAKKRKKEDKLKAKADKSKYGEPQADDGQDGVASEDGLNAPALDANVIPSAPQPTQG